MYLDQTFIDQVQNFVRNKIFARSNKSISMYVPHGTKSLDLARRGSTLLDHDRKRFNTMRSLLERHFCGGQNSFCGERGPCTTRLRKSGSGSLRKWKSEQKNRAGPPPRGLPPSSAGSGGGESPPPPAVRCHATASRPSSADLSLLGRVRKGGAARRRRTGALRREREERRRRCSGRRGGAAPPPARARHGLPVPPRRIGRRSHRRRRTWPRRPRREREEREEEM